MQAIKNSVKQKKPFALIQKGTALGLYLKKLGLKKVRKSGGQSYFFDEIEQIKELFSAYHKIEFND
jgi:hypothetical protein